MIIIGSGGQAGKLLMLCRLTGYKPKGYLSTEPKGSLKHGLPIIGSVEDFFHLFITPGTGFNIAIGEPFIRHYIDRQIAAYVACHTHQLFPVMVHPSAYVAANAITLEGTFIGAQAVIESAAQIGKHCIIDSGAIVEHDCRIADFVNISPGTVIAGRVTVGHNTIIGAGATIRENCTIGSQAVVGAGAVVLRNVPDFAVVAGVPAKVLRYRQAGERTFK